MYHSKIAVKNLLWLSFVFLLYILCGIFLYRPWQQVIEIADINPIVLLQQAHPHAWRLIVASPGLWLDKILNTEVGFGIYTALIGFLSYLLWHQLGGLTTSKLSKFTSLIFLSFFVVMNGRGVFAWFAWLLCIVTCIEFNETRKTTSKVTLIIICLPISLLFSTVSSGAFFVVFMGFIISFSSKVLLCYFRQLTTNLIALIGIFLVMGLGSNYLFLSTQKNLDFYEIDKIDISGILTLTHHGVGYLLEFYWFLLFLPVAFLVVLNLGLYSWRNKRKYGKLFIFFLISLAGGLFGLTTLTLTIPIFLRFFNVQLLT